MTITAERRYGPFCRQGWRVDDDVKRGIVENIDCGRMEIVGWGLGEPKLRLTAAGQRRVEEIFAGRPGAGEEGT